MFLNILRYNYQPTKTKDTTALIRNRNKIRYLETTKFSIYLKPITVQMKISNKYWWNDKKKKPLLECHKCTLTSEKPLLDTSASQLFQNLFFFFFANQLFQNLFNYTNCNFISRPFFSQKNKYIYIYIYIYPTNLPYIIK